MSNEIVLGPPPVNENEDKGQLMAAGQQAADKAVDDVIAVEKKVAENLDSSEIHVPSTDATAIDIATELNNDLVSFMNKNGEFFDSGEFERLPTGIDVLDAILGGGFGVGTFSQIVGNPGTFKSALVAQIIAHNQHTRTDSFQAFYYDSETAMTQQRLASLGVDSPPIQPNSNMSLESIFKAIVLIAAYREKSKLDFPSMIAWDSIAATSAEAEFKQEDMNKTIGLRARMISQLLKRYLRRMQEHKITLLAVNQLRENLNMGQFSPAPDLKWLGNKIIPGGQAAMYMAFHILLLKSSSELKPDANGNLKYGFKGMTLKATTVKNKFFPPNIEVELMVDYNRGISNLWTNYNFLTKHKIITSASWCSFASNPGLKKWRTRDFEDTYNSDPEVKALFDSEVKRAIKTYILDAHGQ